MKFVIDFNHMFCIISISVLIGITIGSITSLKINSVIKRHKERKKNKKNEK